MSTKQQYVEYLVCTIGNYTGSRLAEHLDEVSHDVVTDYLRNEHLTAHGLWELVDRLIQDSPEAFMLVDDSVQDKRYSQFIELVNLQYSGVEHGLVRGIGIVNLEPVCKIRKEENRSECNHGREISSAFFITSGNTAKLF